jgi:O-antigen ligase
VDSPARLRTVLTWLAVCATAAAALALLDYHGLRPLPKLPPPPGKVVTPVEEEEEDYFAPPVRRVVGTGLFQDPNDLCVLLVVALVLALYRLLDARSGRGRFLWLAPLALFAYGFARTQSRGGLLALVAGVGVLVRLRYGWGRALLLGALALPALGAVLGTRQTEISVSTETGRERVQLWSAALTMLRESPVFGKGMNHFTDTYSHVAHNSYLHAFAELGLFGGALFLGAVYLAVWPLYRLGGPAPAPLGRAPPMREITDPELSAMRPFLAGAVAAYAAGMMTLTLCYIIPTYTVLTLAAVFLSLARTRPPTPPQVFTGGLAGRLVLVAGAFLLVMQVTVRLLFRG